MSGRRLAIIGSTGSIGRQTLEVVDESQGLRPVALAAGGSWQLLAEQARKYRPEVVAIADASLAGRLAAELPEGTELLAGAEAMTRLVERVRPDVLLSGVVGMAGLGPTLAAIRCGATLAIANKETLVMAGAIVMPAARAAGAAVLPVDSEHSGVFQCLQAGGRGEVRKVTITASGGSLRDWADHETDQATVSDALNHPTWSMGAKITVDSATMMNKALEIVEAHWLFDLPADELDAVIHPQSVVHSLVEFCDGSVVAQLAMPDMKMPISYALHHPHRCCRQMRPLDLGALGQLTFRPLPPRARRAVELGFEVIRRGGTSGAVVNGANEAAVEAFLAGLLPFGRIVPIVEETLNRSQVGGEVTLDALVAADRWARGQVVEAVRLEARS